jgi:hypothetical protein
VSQHLGFLAAQYRRHSSRLVGTSLGHFGTAGGGQRDGIVGGDDAGDRGCRYFADGVTCDDDLGSGIAEGSRALDQLLVREQGGRHHQGLRDRGVGDLLGRRGRAQPHQIQAAGLRPRSELIRRTW